MMKPVDKILLKLEDCITSGTYIELETEKIELKDLSGGEDWKELYKSIGAFLNSQGGIAILGVKEDIKNKKYYFHGFNPNNEQKLKEIPQKFTNDAGANIDLTEFIRPDLFELRDFLGGRICIIYVEKLPEDKKYILYENIAYERKLTGDHKISLQNIEKQRELRIELELARELRSVDGASLDDLDVDKLNDFIQRLNQGMKIETLKADIPSATSFLQRKKFIVNNVPTMLGMLVCGKNIYDFVEGRCQVDGFVESPIQIASNKKIFKDKIYLLNVFINFSLKIRFFPLKKTFFGKVSLPPQPGG